MIRLSKLGKTTPRVALFYVKYYFKDGFSVLVKYTENILVGQNSIKPVGVVSVLIT